MADAPEVLEHICKLTHLARQVSFDIILECRASEGCPHALSVVVISLGALLTSQRAEKLLAKGQFVIVELVKLIEILLGKDAFAK